MSARQEMMRKAARTLRDLHCQICFEAGDHPAEPDTYASLGADAIESLCAAEMNTAAHIRELQSKVARQRDELAKLDAANRQLREDKARLLMELREARG